MIELFFVALIVVLAIALSAGPMGSLMVWQRVSYFGDAVSHVALLGVALAIIAQIAPFWGAALIALCAGFYLGGLDPRRDGIDANLMLLAYGGLASALLVSSIFDIRFVQLEGFLFGNILYVSQMDAIWLFAASCAVLILISLYWNQILLLTVNPELAASAGTHVKRIRRIFMMVLGLTIAIAANAVGVLLVGAMLIIPALTARYYVKSPEMMAALATGVGVLSGAIGIGTSLLFDLATGPTIICASIVIFLLTRIFKNDLRD